MDTKMKARLEADGWTIGSTQSFLGLSDEDMAVIDMKPLAFRFDNDFSVELVNEGGGQTRK